MQQSAYLNKAAGCAKINQAPKLLYPKYTDRKENGIFRQDFTANGRQMEKFLRAIASKLRSW
jgi:hypothetical protein